MTPGGIVPIAVLGLGIIGVRATQRLIDAEWPVKSWNRTPKGHLTEVGSSAKAISGAAIISIYLKDSFAVREVMESLVNDFIPGQMILNHATLDLETTLWLKGFFAARGCQFLDAPFTGSKLAAESGQLLYYIGGDAQLAAEVDTYLAVSSRGRLYCGEVGSATVVKLATNLISACTVQAMAEALAITNHHGVASKCLLRAVSENASNSVLAEMKLPMMVAGNFETHFSLSNMAKDSRYMVALAKSANLETPAIAAVSKRMSDLSAEGLGELDFSAVAKPYQEK